MTLAYLSVWSQKYNQNENIEQFVSVQQHLTAAHSELCHATQTLDSVMSILRPK